MKKKISLIILFFTITSLFFVAIPSCTDNINEEDKIVYQQGMIQGKDIYDQFECIGEKQSKTFFGSNGTKTIYCQQTATGGWVAWTAKRYIYTQEDVGANSILNEAAIKFITPLKFE